MLAPVLRHHAVDPATPTDLALESGRLSGKETLEATATIRIGGGLDHVIDGKIALE